MITQPRTANKLDFADIRVGDVFSFEKVFTRRDGLSFAKLSGDFNPLHVDAEFGERSRFGKNVVHGMLVAGLFSTIVGMYCPGEKSLYLSQTAKFIKPVFYGDNIVVKGIVSGKSDAVQVVHLRTEIWRGDVRVAEGEAVVKFLSQ